MAIKRKINTKAIKKRLLEMREKVEKLSEVTKGARQPVELDQTMVGRLSRMDALQIQAMQLETERRRTIEIKRIDATLQRMDEGEFGYCVSCGVDIETKRLENDADLEWTSEQSPDVELSDDPEERAAQIARLERLVRAAKFQPRFVAVKTLSRIRDLDRVPALIYALSDRDPLIRQQSRAGLRFISRKFGGFGLPDDPAGPPSPYFLPWRDQGMRSQS